MVYTYKFSAHNLNRMWEFIFDIFRELNIIISSIDGDEKNGPYKKVYQGQYLSTSTRGNQLTKIKTIFFNTGLKSSGVNQTLGVL